MQVAFAFKHEIASNTPDIAYLTTLDRFGKENATLSEPLIYIDDHFTKTGSGQTLGKHSKKRGFFAGIAVIGFLFLCTLVRK
jgi:hypothetical protein